MNTRSNFKTVQGSKDNSMGDRAYQGLQNIIFDQTRVECSIVVFPNHISIRPKSGLYSDYCLARAAIRQIVTQPIQRDER